MKRIGLFLFAFLFATFPLYSQIVNIPDANFLDALIEEGVDTNEDGQISVAEAEAITYLFLWNRSISDMTGIEAFYNLDTLYCISNPITNLDVSNNTKLVFFECSQTQLTSLDIFSSIEKVLRFDIFPNLRWTQPFSIFCPTIWGVNTLASMSLGLAFFLFHSFSLIFIRVDTFNGVMELSQ